MTTFVLLHGGACGAWTWRYTEQALRAAGHDVLTVTFTGFAERRHLLGIDSNIQTHVVDVVNALEYHDIVDAVLVCHSYSGAVAPGVVALAGQRLRRVVYIDAIILERGESVAEGIGFMSAAQAAGMLAGLRAGTVSLSLPVQEQERVRLAEKPYRMSSERQQWLLDHMCAMPTAASVVPAEVGAESITLSVDYIAAADSDMKPLMHDRARQLGWTMHEIDCDHSLPIGDPKATVELLQRYC